MRYFGRRLLAAFIVVAMAGASALALPSLPAQVATHWNAAGQPDDTMPRLVGAFLLPAITAGVTLLLYVAPRFDPRYESIESFRGGYEWFVVGMVAFLAYVHGMTLAWNLGLRFSFTAAMALPLAGLFLGLGELLARARPNWTIGIRTPWTLSDDDVWTETHRRGAWAFRALGVATLVAVAVPDLLLPVVLGGALLVAGYTMAFSYVAYRRRHAG
ncbi:SdpI family protein [Halobaculum marinum]|uniref:SdpI family protein n=1 Tax=Halobaculum marinum TaxID=3031996 RepID=A0ABD5WRC5_9EURY|nr:DUF1648 domain-containing protein [Halobaculum sp. DT55]